MRLAILAPASIESPSDRELGPPRAIRDFVSALRLVPDMEVQALRVRLTPCPTEVFWVDGLRLTRCWVGNVGTVLRELRVDVLQSFSTTATSLAGFRTGKVAQRLGALWVDTILGLVRIEHEYGYVHQPQAAVFEQLRFANADCVVFPSLTAMDVAKKHYGSHVWKQSRVIPLGIDEEWLRAGTWYDTPARERPLDNRLHVVSVGAIAPHKGQDFLLRSFDESHVEGVLELVGPEQDSAYSEALRRMGGDLDPEKRLSFAGFVTHEKVAQTLRAANVFALLSRFDVFPAVVLEAMALGHAPLLSVSVGNSSLIQDM